jgi:hypothetical protein
MLAVTYSIAKFLFGMNEVLMQLRVELLLSTLATPQVNTKETAMKYLLLCQRANAPTAALAKMHDVMIAYNRQLTQTGVLVAGGQLAPPETAQRVLTQNGRIKTEEGFALAADTQIGGYYVVDVPGEPKATGWAAKCPLAQAASLEVRQVVFSPL